MNLLQHNYAVLETVIGYDEREQNPLAGTNEIVLAVLLWKQRPKGTGKNRLSFLVRPIAELLGIIYWQ